jgi:energy-coupling factor transporter ATP-binding protein EcfA2
MQVEGIFDVPIAERSAEEWNVDLTLPDQWNVGLIVGPSGCGKTTIARELFGDAFAPSWNWSHDKAIVDDFPRDMSIKDITGLLSSVGFSSPPSWLRPYGVLSNGEQFRVGLARTLAEMPDLCVIDEFTSVVDRTVAQIGSAAVQKTVRRRNQRLIAVSCHHDIVEWLEPDWVYQPHTGELLVGRSLHQRPPITLTIRRVHRSAWELFKRHHYMSAKYPSGARAWVAFIDDTPTAITAWEPHVGTPINMWREARTVTLPDYQGVGIGNALADYIAAACRGVNKRAGTSTAHPAMIAARNRSLLWKMTSIPRQHRRDRRADFARATNRLTASFEYVGSALPPDEARAVWDGVGIGQVKADGRTPN